MHAIVTVEGPSQVHEGNLDSTPPLIESSSLLLGGTFLDPLREFPLTVSAGESGRQLSLSITDAIHTSNSNEMIEMTEDQDL